MKREKILSGVMTLLIMIKLLDGPSYGYALGNYVSERLERPIPPGAIYVILSSLDKRKLISISEKGTLNGRNITKYQITDSGMEFLRRHKDPLKVASRVIEDISQTIQNLV